MEKKPYKLTKIESKLIHLLELDARKPYSYYAKKLKISQEAVVRRINKLKKKKIIDNFYTIINLPKIGYMYCRIWIKYNKINQETENALIKRLKNNPKVGWIIMGEGVFDMIVLFVIKTIEELKHDTQDFFSENTALIKEKDISIQTQVNHFNHNYLFEDKDHVDIKYRDIKNKVNLDKRNIAILKLLAKDARMNTMDIAENLGFSYNTVKRRIKEMIDNNIILGFKPKINCEPLGYQHFKIFLTLERLDIESIKKIKTYLTAHPNVVYITKALGRYDLEFEIELVGRKDLNLFLRQLKERFFNIIRDYSVLQHYSEPHINYFPEGA